MTAWAEFAGLAAIAVAAQGGTGSAPLYEEELAASTSARSAAYQQVVAYVDALVARSIAPAALWSPDYADEQAYAASAAPLRAELARRLGYPAPGALSDPVVSREQVGRDGIAIYHRLSVAVLPGVELYGLYLVPSDAEGPRPLVIAQHGGGGFPELALYHGGANYHDMVRGAVQRGYVVWAPALVFNTFGEEVGLPAGVRQLLDRRARRAGTTLAGIEATEITTALTAVLRQPEVEPDRVAMVGLSYGGFYTLYVTALEPRITVAVSSCFFNDRNSILAASEPFGWDDMQYLGGGVSITDADIAALVCPRPLQVQVGVSDDLFPVDGARRAAPNAKAHYEALGMGDRFEFVECEGGHEFFGEPAWRFLERWL